MSTNKCFSIKSYDHIKILIDTELNKNKKNTIVFFIKNYLVEGFGIGWLNTLIKLVNKNYKQYNIKFYVDSGTNFGMALLIIKENIHYLKLRSNKNILKKINEIAKKNKVVLNPNFAVVDISKKNYKI